MDCFTPPFKRVTLLTLALLTGLSGCAKNSALEQALAAASSETAPGDTDNTNVNNQILALIADQKGANRMSENIKQKRRLILKKTDAGIRSEHEFILNTFMQLNPPSQKHLASLHVPTGKGDFVLMGTRLRHARLISDKLTRHGIWAEIRLDPDLPEDQLVLVMNPIFDKSVTPHGNGHNEQ